MLVTQSNFDSVLADIRKEEVVAVDTETTGLKVYGTDHLFSIIITTSVEDFYFNFNENPDHLGNKAPVILERNMQPYVVGALANMRKLYMANAKFDMGMIDKEIAPYFKGGFKWPEIHDVLTMDRLLYNDHMSYSLDQVAKRNGLEKMDEVENYIKEHGLWAWEVAPHRKKRDKLKFFDKVPFDIIMPYGCKDGRVTYQIGTLQEPKLATHFKKIRTSSMNPYEIEVKTTSALYRMEKEGILLDETYAKEKAQTHQTAFEEVARKFHDETRQVFVDSAETLSPLFSRAGFIPPKTEDGNDSLTDEWLETINTPLGNMVRLLRSDLKSTNFYKSYIHYKDERGLIHANVNQSGTRTGRFSMSNPNLQQTPDSEVRKAFIAPEDYVLASLDFDQQEYRMMLDYAEQEDLIAEVRGGLDVHTATAQLTGVGRQEAKTLNFMLLYGGGVVKLALALFKVTTTEPILWVIWKQANGWKLDVEDKKWLPMLTDELVAANLPELYKAEKLRKLYFSKLPKVEKLIDECRETAAARGYIHTWTGRRVYFKRQFAYKAPNALIQGGASDVCKIAIIEIDKVLSTMKSKLLLSIHDELVLKVHKEEMGVIGLVRGIMERSFPHKHLPLTVAANVGPNLWEMEKYV